MQLKHRSIILLLADADLVAVGTERCAAGNLNLSQFHRVAL
jgi:hypothetical protein